MRVEIYPFFMRQFESLIARRGQREWFHLSRAACSPHWLPLSWPVESFSQFYIEFFFFKCDVLGVRNKGSFFLQHRISSTPNLHCFSFLTIKYCPQSFWEFSFLGVLVLSFIICLSTKAFGHLLGWVCSDRLSRYRLRVNQKVEDS